MLSFRKTTQVQPLGRQGRFAGAVVALVVGGVGAILFLSSHALTPTASLEVENGAVTSLASNVIDATASNGHAVKFSGTTGGGGGGGCPGDRVITDWPGASNVGLLCTTTKTISGDVKITSASWFTSNGFPGSGTVADPYLVDRVLFTGEVKMSGSLGGKYVVFSNDRFYGHYGNPTPEYPDPCSYLWAEDSGAPFFTVKDSTLGPNLPILSTGGTSAGTQKGIFSYVPFTAIRNNIYGSNVPIGMEIDKNEGASLIQDNYLHDIWSDSDDHTDLINGNFHASHMTIRHNYLDGIRVGNDYVVNGIGIYDDPADSSGIITDWTIDNNYFDRSASMIFSNTDTSRFTNPYVVTNNTFTNRFTNGRFVSRHPSTQSGNVDQTGKALTF